MSFHCESARAYKRQRVKEVAIALALSAAVAAIAIFAHPAKAKASECRPDNNGRMICSGDVTTLHARRHIARYADANGNRADPKPRAWCGWWLRQYLGVKDRAGNLARWWASFGTAAHGPAVGVIVVWRHHVGILTARSDGGWIVKSGNDGHAVRERERSLRGVIAYRWPHGSLAVN